MQNGVQMSLVHRKQNTGSGIIQALILLGIMSILIGSVASLIINQNQKLSIVHNKVDIAKYESLIRSSLSLPYYCRCVFNGHTYNKVTNSWNSFPNQLKESYDFSTCNSIDLPNGLAGSSSDKILSLNESIPENSELVIEKFESTTLVEAPVSSGTYFSQFIIDFDQSQFQQKLNPIRIPMTLNFNPADPDTNKQVLSCGLSDQTLLKNLNCRICFQCGHHDEEGTYTWRDGTEECALQNNGLSNWSENTVGGDEETGGFRCRINFLCS